MAKSSDSWTLQGIKNPMLLQSLILDKFEDDSGGQYMIADANNVTSWLIEGFASMAAKMIQKIDDETIPAIYPARALSAKDLYKHLSDYDYLGLFASPATASIIMIVSKTYLMAHAVEVPGEAYKKVVIPQTTRFTLGEHTFGLYYPIEIRVSAATGMFTVIYDTSKQNPLHTLTQNILEYNIYKYDGTALAYIKIPVYQFDIDTTEEPLISGSGYKRVLNYEDKFYAIKCVCDVKNKETGEWESQELELALSGMSYNPEKPTAVFTVDPANNQVTVEIPYVYFTSELIRGNLKIEIYTTKGELNYDIPMNTEELVGIDMLSVPLSKELEPYVTPFRKMPGLGAVPTFNKVVGGSNGMSYAELKRRVVSDALGDMTLQTPSDIDAYFGNLGYTTTLFQDGITDRIFNAHAVIKDSDNSIISCASMNTLFTKDILAKSSHIVEAEAEVFTVLPSMRYRFDPDRGICIPLTDDELNILNALRGSDLLAAYNNNVYTLSPFHLHISTKNKYPITITYDLTDTDIESREFLKDQTNLEYHLSISAAHVQVMPVSVIDNITDRYRLSFKLIRSGLDDVEAVLAGSDGVVRKNIRVILAFRKIDGTYAFAEARWVERVGNLDEFEIMVPATAIFKQQDGSHFVRVLKGTAEDSFSQNFYMPLTGEIRVMLCLSNGTITGTSGLALPVGVNQSLETDISTATNIEGLDEFTVLSENRLTIRFGKVVNELDQRVTLTYSGAAYETYGTTEFSVLEQPIYKKDENGNIVYRIENEGTADEKVILEEEYPVGTLKCFTKIVEEEIVFCAKLARNYSNCEYKVDASVGEWSKFPDEFSSESDLAKSLNGKRIAVKMHLTPRFYINNTTQVPGDVTSPVGTFEIDGVLNPDVVIGQRSSSHDVWWGVIGEVGASDNVDTYKIFADDALSAILDLIIEGSPNFIDGTGSEDPLVDIVMPDGSIVAVQNDKSDRGESAATVTFDVVEHDEGLVTKFYMMYRGEWKCFMKAKNTLDEVKKMYKIERDGYRSPSTDKYEDDVDYYTYNASATPPYQKKEKGTDYEIGDTIPSGVYIHAPSTRGYVYRCESSMPASSKVPQYIAFLNTRDGVPDCTLRDIYGRTSEDEVLDLDYAWKTEVNKWPWEVKEWARIKTVDELVYFDVDSAFLTRFDNGRLAKYCNHTSNQVRLDDLGEPIADTGSRQIQYLVNMFQCDAKLAAVVDSETKVREDYPDSIVETLRTHFSTLGAAKNRLYTSTKLYFEPMRSLGLGQFYTDGESTEELPLDVTMRFRLHISQSASEDNTILDALRKSIISIIDENMSTDVTNCAKIANEITERNSDTVKHVDVLGINGNEDLQTMRCVDKSVRPHLKHQLVRLDDGQIEVDRGLEIEYVVADV